MTMYFKVIVGALGHQINPAAKPTSLRTFLQMNTTNKIFLYGVGGGLVYFSKIFGKIFSKAIESK
jgi:hypothetical protein